MDSVVNQTLKSIEIICINDGSTDGSLDILKSYAEKDNRIRIIDKKNSGYGHSMNMGIDAATGEYIGIVESDDFAEPDMFKKLYKTAEKDDLDVARSNFYYYTTSTGENVKSSMGYVPHNKVFAPSEKLPTFYQQPSVWANIYRTSFIKDNGIRFLETPGASYQDTAFTFKVYAMAKRFKMIDDPLIHYRIDGGSSSFQNTTKVFCVSDEYNEIKRFIKEKGIYHKYKRLVPHLQYRGYKWNYKRLVEPYDQEFLKRWHDEFREEFENGNISKDVFSPEEYEDVMDVVKTGKLSKAKVSVVIPVYNMEPFLRKCMDSVVNQTLKEIEIICVNDGSTDNSLKILQEYSSNDTRVKIIDKKNGGLSSARNAGMKAATAKFIAFVDSDDWLELDAYETVIKGMKGAADIVIFGTNVVGDAMLDRRKADEEYYRVKYSGLIDLNDNVRLRVDVAAWNKLYRRSLIEEHGLEFPVGKLYEDYSFYWRYIFLCKKAYFETAKKYNYLRREGSIMYETFGKNKRAMEHLEVFEGIYDFLKNENNAPDSKDCISSIFLNCFWFAYLNVPNEMKQDVLKLGTKYVKEMNLTGNDVLDNLRYKRYSRVLSSQSRSGRQKLENFLFAALRKITGRNLEALKSTFIDTDPVQYDVHRAVASTRWVHDHENYYNIKRWKTVYDCNSEDLELNWGHKGGIKGGQTVRSEYISKLVRGHECRVYISLWGVQSAVLDGVILTDDRAIFGTSIYDGVNVYTISVDIGPKAGTIRAYSFGHKNSKDYSENCRILKVERSA